ncbi:hypothetical protein N7490_000485 [Penicillium lividum]|nr:hypothetical protein N7490_000485 [Penicillium lividum]
MADSSASFSAKQYRDDEKLHVVLAATGSVATIKLPNIAEALCRHPSISSLEQPILDGLRQIKGVDAVYRDDDEWGTPWTRGANILHIELRKVNIEHIYWVIRKQLTISKWAHVLLIAPLSANTMAKMSVGIADNLLLSVVRAWDTTGLVDQDFKIQKPRIFVAPAMNTAMWHQPITHQNLGILRDQWGWSPTNPEGWVTVLPPIDKPLACGDVGSGGMMDWRDIVRSIEEHLGLLAVQS